MSFSQCAVPKVVECMCMLYGVWQSVQASIRLSLENIVNSRNSCVLRVQRTQRICEYVWCDGSYMCISKQFSTEPTKKKTTNLTYIMLHIKSLTIIEYLYKRHKSTYSIINTAHTTGSFNHSHFFPPQIHKQKTKTTSYKNDKKNISTRKNKTIPLNVHHQIFMRHSLFQIIQKLLLPG